MFNAQQKQQFIEEHLFNSKVQNEEKENKRWCDFFDRLEKIIEKDLNLDFSEFDYDTTMLALSLIGGSKAYQDSIFSQLRQYNEWCIRHGKTHAVENCMSGIESSDIDLAAAYRLTMLKDQQQLFTYANSVYAHMAEDKIDNLYRAYWCLLYSGVEPKMAIQLKEQQIDFVHEEISFEDKKVRMDTDLIEVIAYLIRMPGYMKKGRYGAYLKRKASTGYVLDLSTVNRENILQYVRSNLSIGNQELRTCIGKNISLTSTSIFESGIYNRMFMNEMKTGMVDMGEYLAYKMRDVSKEMEKQKRLWLENRFKKQILSQYKNWKSAFHL